MEWMHTCPKAAPVIVLLLSRIPIHCHAACLVLWLWLWVRAVTPAELLCSRGNGAFDQWLDQALPFKSAASALAAWLALLESC